MNLVQYLPILGTANVVHVGFHLLTHLAEDLVSVLGKSCSKLAIITDANVAPLYLTPLRNTLRHADPCMHLISFVLPPGERTKSRSTKAVIEDWLLYHQCTRDTVIVALGGGVVGDLVGFVAATYMRGCRFVQIPTTLLAMVDSSIGGKTAIDVSAGKNLIGAFHQPLRIYIDPAFLSTLALREIKNGMAEVIKTAAFGNANLFALLEQDPEAVLQSVVHCDQDSVVARIILETAMIKASIVSADEKEGGLRGLLNFGHTVGHAFEAALTPWLLHGECVALGMVHEAEIARRLGHLSQSDLGRLVQCISNYGLPTSLHDPLVVSHLQYANLPPRTPVSKLLEYMNVDKKNSGATKKIVLLAGIGSTVEQRASAVSDDIIRLVISPGVRVHPSILSELPANVRVLVPGSKSISNRALLLSALTRGTTSIHNLLHSDDTQVMLTALQRLGACTYTWNRDVLVVNGRGGVLEAPSDIATNPIYLGNAGTAARFLTCAISLVHGKTNVTVTGNSRMQQRPIRPLVDALVSNGIPITCSSMGCLPVTVDASQNSGFPGGHIKLSATISSQYVSAILMCAPFARKPVTLELIGDKVISQSYIDLTIAMMKSFGVHVVKESPNLYKIPQSVYTPPPLNEYTVEPDASSATYPLALAAITGRTVTVAHLGSLSLQGDAQFAMDILKPMGCTVTQTDTETTVSGPAVGTLQSLGHVDMEHLTDAFLTASVLAAVAAKPNKEGSTKTIISGIANQRVKECNRIQAMRTELGKFGVQTDEHNDGITITGHEWTSLKGDASVFCYDDHRVAMSMSVFGALIGSCLEERKCVEKTWPAWWDTLETVLGVSVSGHDVLSGHRPLPKVKEEPPMSVVLIGMRGAGKSTFGRAVAKSLNRRFIDVDEEFVLRHNGQSIRDWIATQSENWSAFRAAEALLVKELIEAYPTGTIIACGGGVVETANTRDFLMHLNNVKVVHVRRSIDGVLSELHNSSRPSLGEEDSVVWARRCPWYEQCASAEFFVASADDGTNHWPQITRELVAFVERVTVRTVKQSKLEQMSGKGRKLSSTASSLSSFVSLTLPKVTESDRPLILQVVEGVDAVELRADLLQDVSLESIAQTFFVLRRITETPIIFTVRTVSQGGAWPDETVCDAVRVMEAAVRWGADAVDVQIGWPMESITRLRRMAKRRGVLTIASYHDPQGAYPWTNTVHWATQLYSAASFGDIVKLVGRAHSTIDNDHLQKFVSTVAADALGTRTPLIAINMGEPGKWSRVMNSCLTPVTHPKLTAAAPGQISLCDIHKARSACGIMPGTKKFYLLGDPIAQSRSPAIHNGGFMALGLPYEYNLYPSREVTPELTDMIVKDPDFGGCSVTIPLKEKVHVLVQEMTPAARAIGAINTIWRRGDVLVGDNTDVDGIREAVASRELTSAGSRDALVLGAGGTARAAVYALLTPKSPSSNVTRIVVVNRTLARAQALIADFGPLAHGVKLEAHILNVASFALAEPKWAVVVSTMPRDVQVQYEWPSSWFAGTEVLVEMVYGLPTPIMGAAKGDVHVVTGIEVLLHQAFGQFERWTGMCAPRHSMRVAAVERTL